MTVTQSSWKQVMEARQGFDFPRWHVVVSPKGCVTLSFANKVLVRDEEEVPKLLDSDKVTINEDCCCPPIEFNLIMGESDVNRPGISRPSYARFIWITNVPTFATVQYRISGATTGWSWEVSGTLEERYHEYFGYPIVPETDYEFRILAFRDFCGDGTTSQIYSFTVCAGAIEIETPSLWTWGIVKESLTLGSETTIAYSAFGTSMGTTPESGQVSWTLSLETTPVTFGGSTTEVLTDTFFFTAVSTQVL